MRKLFVLFALAVFSLSASWASPIDYLKSYLFLRGMEAVDAGNYGDAVEWFEKELVDHPDNGYAYYQIGNIKNLYEFYGGAIESYDKAIEKLGKVGSKQRDVETIARCYLFKAQIHALLGEHEECDYACQKALSIAPDSYSSYEHAGRVLHYAAGRDLEAVRYYEKAVKLAPYMGDVRVGLADCYYNLYLEAKAAGNAEQAEKLLSNAERELKLAQSLGESESELRSKIHVERNEWGDAISEWMNALRDASSRDEWLGAFSGILDCDILAHDVASVYIKANQVAEPNNSLWFNVSFFTHLNHAEYADALDDIFQSSRVSDQAPNWSRMMDCLLGMRAYDDALDCFDRMMQETSWADMIADGVSGDARAFFFALYEKGEYDRALDSLNVLGAESFDLQELFVPSILIAKGSVEDALDFYSKLLERDPENAEAYLNRGALYKKLGLADKAKHDFTMALEFIKNMPLALAYLGREDEAVAALSQPVMRNQGYYDLAKVYSVAGDIDNAKKCLAQALDLGMLRYRRAQNDIHLANLWSKVDFDEFMAPYFERIDKMKAQLGLLLDSEVKPESLGSSVDIPYVPESGVCKVRCSINGLPLHFIFDTGASDVTISSVEASFMLKNGYLSEKDISGKQYYQTADGSVSAGTTIVLRNVCFGGLTLTNVKASVVESQNAPLLLGQSVLQRLGNIEIDNKAKVIRISK